jgi:hypothetical protein
MNDNQLMHDWQRRTQCPALDMLANIIKPIIADCQTTIEGFLEKALNKYGKRLLRPVESKRSLADVARMVQWNLCETEDVKKLQDKLNRSIEYVQLVQTQAQGLSLEQDRDVVSERLNSIVDAARQADEKLDARFEELLGKLEAQSTITERIDAKIDTATTIVCSTKAAVIKIESTVARISQRLAGLDMYNENTVFIEDSLGWKIPIPLEIVQSWKTLESILDDKFKDRPGRAMVRLRQYALYDSSTNRDLQRHLPLHTVLRPKQNLLMSMTYHADWDFKEEASRRDHRSVCPTCARVCKVEDADLDVTWFVAIFCSDVAEVDLLIHDSENPRCGMIYRRVLDVSGLEDDCISRQATQHLETYQGRQKFEDEEDETECLDIETEVLDDWLRSNTIQEGPDVFKRVRLLTRWEDCSESIGPVLARRGRIHLWGVSKNGFATTADFQIRVSMLVQLITHTSLIYKPNHGRWICNDGEELWFHVGFLGYTKANSNPVIVILSDSSRHRQRAIKVMQKLEWLKSGSRFQIFSGPLSTLYPEDTKLSVEKNYEESLSNPTSFQARIYRRSYELLGECNDLGSPF